VDTEHEKTIINQHDLLLDDELADIFDDEGDGNAPKYENAERILHLIRLLRMSECTREDILKRLRGYYSIDEEDGDPRRATRNASQMFRRDTHFLKKVGFEISKNKDASGIVRYTLLKSSGPISPLLFKQDELATLALLYTMFVDPTTFPTIDVKQLLSAQKLRHPFARDILHLIERLIDGLSPQQNSLFKQYTQKPPLYFNLEAATNYLPHRGTIDTIARAISLRQQLSFAYMPTPFPQDITPHRQVDPYYLIQQDEHIYLVGFSHEPANPRKNRVFEWRIDRIKTESIKLEHGMANNRQRPRPITFHYWADISIAKSGLSQRWITHEVERDETTGEGRQQRRRLLVRAQAYNGWRIIQQLHKYGDRVELVDPPELREQMKREVKRMYDLYF